MNNDYNYFPKLIEPGTKYFLFETLKKCNVNKSNYYNTIFNFLLLLIFIFILGIILIYKNNTKLSIDDEKRKKELRKKYILEKIKIFKRNKQENQNITNLPNFESVFVNLHKKYYSI